MQSQEQIQQAIFLFLVHNQQTIKNLVKPLTDQKLKLINSEETVFKDDILKQYEDLVRWEITIEIAKALAVSTESVIIEIQNLNLSEYLQ